MSGKDDSQFYYKMLLIHIIEFITYNDYAIVG